MVTEWKVHPEYWVLGITLVVALRGCRIAVLAGPVDLRVTVAVHVDETVLLEAHVAVHEVLGPHRIARETGLAGVLVPIGRRMGLDRPNLGVRFGDLVHVTLGDVDDVRVTVSVHVEGVVGPVVRNARVDLGTDFQARAERRDPREMRAVVLKSRALVPDAPRGDVRNAVVVVVPDRAALCEELAVDDESSYTSACRPSA